jgi:hypothetical protein
MRRAQASRSFLISLVQRVCSRRWIGFECTNQDIDASPDVCSHLPSGPSKRPAERGFKQCCLRHTRLVLAVQKIGDFPLPGLPHMLWSPSSFEGRVSGVYRESSINSRTVWCALSLPPKRRTCTSNGPSVVSQYSHCFLFSRFMTSEKLNVQTYQGYFVFPNILKKRKRRQFLLYSKKTKEREN